MNPAAPLQSSAEDFLESLQQSPGSALAELINLVLRACGCSDSVNADEAADFDGIVSTLDDFTESLKQVCAYAILRVTLENSSFFLGKFPRLSLNFETPCFQTFSQISLGMDRTSHGLRFRLGRLVFNSNDGYTSAMGCLNVVISDS